MQSVHTVSQITPPSKWVCMGAEGNSTFLIHSIYLSCVISGFLKVEVPDV